MSFRWLPPWLSIGTLGDALKARFLPQLLRKDESVWQGATWMTEILGGSDGAHPQGAVVIGNDGVLYSTTTQGGTSSYGTGFELAPPASPGGAWTETVLYNFTGGSDGGCPWASLVIGKSRALYGTTSMGGPSNTGTWFQLTP